MSDYQPAPPPSTPYSSAPGGRPTPVLSILSTVFGGLGFLTGLLTGFGLLFGAAGIVLGLIARRREPQGRVLQLIGIIAGAIAVVVNLAIIALLVVALVSGAAHGTMSNG